MKRHCFYHGADLDGKCSGAIVLKRYPDTIMHPINYGDPFPWNEIGSDDTVYMVDFALQPYEEMIQLDALCNVVWIDHHKSAMVAMDELGGFNPPGIRDEAKAACELTWSYLYPQHRCPQTVTMLGRWDVWDHEIFEVKPFQYGMRAIPNNPEEPMWDALLRPEAVFNADLHVLSANKMMNAVLRNGHVIISYEENKMKSEVSQLYYEKTVTIKGKDYRAIIANRPFGGSQTFGGYHDPEKHDLMMTFFRHPQGIWTVNLYTHKGGIDVSEICKSMGGGGHPNAGGFQMLMIDWLLS